MVMPAERTYATGMMDRRQAHWLRAGWALLIGLILYRLWVLWAVQPPLDLEETYYLYWSTHPDLGYYSKPPMVAWLLAGFTSVFGVSALSIKLVSLSLHSLTAGLVYLIGRQLWSPLAGVAGAVTFFSLPIIGALALFTSTDAALHFFWALTLWAFVRARDSDRLGWWVLAGIAGGLGLMSKYTMGVLAIGLLGYLIASPIHRALLRRPGLWVAAVLAALVWAPNLWWNAQHDFISFRHTAEISQLDRAWLRPDALMEFLLPQWPMFGLLLAPLLLWSLKHCRDDGTRLLLWVSLPMLAVISLQALLAEAHINWASAAYVGLGLLAGACVARLYPRWWMAAVGFNLALLSVAYHYHDIARGLGVPLTAATDPYRKRVGWQALGDRLAPLLARHPGTVLVSDDRKLLAYLGYYASPWPPRIARWNPQGRIVSQYDLERHDLTLGDQPVVFVSKQPIPAAVTSRFAQVRDLGVVEQPVYPDLVRQVYAVELRGFKGYAE